MSYVESDISDWTEVDDSDSSEGASAGIIVISSDSWVTDSSEYDTATSSDGESDSMASIGSSLDDSSASFSGEDDVEEVPMELVNSRSNSPADLEEPPAAYDEDFEELPPPPPIVVTIGQPPPVESARDNVQNENDPQPSTSAAGSEENDQTTKTAVKRSAAEMDSDSGDDEQRCPICLDSWSGTGEHRLCSLACGHLFGMSCIERWLKKGTAGRRCPQCNLPCKKSDIRPLFASALRVKEVAEEEKLQKQLDQALKEKRELEVRLMRTELMMAELKKKEAPSLQHQQLQVFPATPVIPAVRPGGKKLMFQLAKEISLGDKGGGRVMSYCPWATQLCVSQASKLSGFGVVQLHCERNFLPQCRETLHGKMIRDMTYCPEQTNSLLLTASLDRTAKLLDYRCNGHVQTYRAAAPLWSCCWDMTGRVGVGSTCNLVTVGMTSGVVARFDLRMANTDPVTTLAKREDQSPVSSLVSLPPGCCPSLPRGGLIVSQLTTCRLYVGDNDEEGTLLPFQSPFLCVRAEGVSGHILVSTRASNGHPTTHTVYRLSQDPNIPPHQLFESVLTIQGANRQNFLTRPCIAQYKDNDLIVAANQEESSTVPLWSVTTGSRIASLPTAEDVLDIANFSVNANDYYAFTTDKKVVVYKYQ